MERGPSRSPEGPAACFAPRARDRRTTARPIGGREATGGRAPPRAALRRGRAARTSSADERQASPRERRSGGRCARRSSEPPAGEPSSVHAAERSPRSGGTRTASSSRLAHVRCSPQIRPDPHRPRAGAPASVSARSVGAATRRRTCSAGCARTPYAFTTVRRRPPPLPWRRRDGGRSHDPVVELRSPPAVPCRSGPLCRGATPPRAHRRAGYARGSQHRWPSGHDHTRPFLASFGCGRDGPSDARGPPKCRSRPFLPCPWHPQAGADYRETTGQHVNSRRSEQSQELAWARPKRRCSRLRRTRTRRALPSSQGRPQR